MVSPPAHPLLLRASISAEEIQENSMGTVYIQYSAAELILGKKKKFRRFFYLCIFSRISIPKKKFKVQPFSRYMRESTVEVGNITSKIDESSAVSAG